VFGGDRLPRNVVMVASNACSGLSQAAAATLLLTGRAILRLGLNATTVAGAGVGGVIVAVANPGVAIAVDAVSFGVAALALAAMRLPASNARSPSTISVVRRHGVSY
jgi:hypothetical protein